MILQRGNRVRLGCFLQAALAALLFAAAELRAGVPPSEAPTARVAQSTPAEALASAQKLVDMTEQQHGPKARQLVNPLLGLATAQHRVKDEFGAERNYRRVLALAETYEGANSPDLITALAGLGAVYAENGDYDASVQSLRRGIDLSRKLDGLLNPQQLDMKTNTLVAIATFALFTACASAPKRVAELDDAHVKVTALSNDPLAQQAASRELAAARSNLEQADAALKKGEPQTDVAHFAYLATRNAEIGEARIDEFKARDEVKKAEGERNRVLLEARTREAEGAKQQVAAAEATAEMKTEEAESARRELAELQAKKTDRGMVMRIVRAACLIDPVRAIASSNSILPGPIEHPGPRSIRNRTCCILLFTTTSAFRQ